MIIKVGDKFKIGIMKNEYSFWRSAKMEVKDVVITQIKKLDNILLISGEYDGYMPFTMYEAEFKRALRFTDSYIPDREVISEIEI